MATKVVAASQSGEGAAIATAKAMPNGPSKRTVERAFERATEHPNAPPRLRAKARRQRKRETLQAYHQLLATLPRTVEGARRFYLAVEPHPRGPRRQARACRGAELG